MADWFETRFREPVDAGQLDPAFVARMRALVVEEWQADAGTTPPDFTDTDDREGDIIMLETETHPTGHEPETPGRRAPGRWLLVAAVAAVVAVVGGLFVVSSGDDEDQVVPATSPPTTAPAQDVTELQGELESGRYFVDPDADETTPLRVTFQVEPEGWVGGWFGSAKWAESGHTALSIATVTNVVNDGCRDHTPVDPPVGPTVDDLATALSQLAPFEVTAPPTDVTLFGYEGKHLALTAPALTTPGVADCVDDGELHSWIAPINGGSFYGYGPRGGSEQFWILDVAGTRVVIVKYATSDAPTQDIAERDAIFDTIRIEP